MIVPQKTSSFKSSAHPLAGFTLVEMMVAVALVLLMMSMFAQIFQMATGALSTQKGIAENDQKARMVTSIIRGDLDHRSFRDVFPFRSNEDTRQLGHSLDRRRGYFEIDEGDPTSDIDDVLQITTQVNIRLQNKDTTPYTGKATALTINITGYPNSSSITIAGNYTSYLIANTNVWISGSSSNDGRYTISGTPTFSSGETTITFTSSSLNTSQALLGAVGLTESQPEFDDGVFANGTSTSTAAEVCYFLRNGTLYRRVLLIRDPGVGGTTQPTYSTGHPVLWNGSAEYYPLSGSSTFWRDFDYSAFYFNGKNASLAPGVHFHSATESLSNSSQAPRLLINDSGVPTTNATSFPISLGIPNLRFGHSTSNGLAQDASTSASLTTGGAVTINRFTQQECANSNFGYPGYLPNDPVSGTANTNPYDRGNIQVDPITGLVVEYSNQTFRRGEDILMSNVLTFDIKVWDPFFGGFVDVGDSTLNPGGPFSSTAAGLLNAGYGGTANHYRFDTWHPLASSGGGANAGEPPFVPLDGSNRPFALMAIQITINYRDVSSNQVRQTTIVQSLVDRVKPSAVTNEAPEE